MSGRYNAAPEPVETGWEVDAFVVRKTPAGETYVAVERLDLPDDLNPIVETGWAMYRVEDGLRAWVGDYFDRDLALQALAMATGRTFAELRGLVGEGRHLMVLDGEGGAK